MTIVAVVFFPVVLAYQAWNFWVFRSRIRSPRAGSPDPITDDVGTPAPDTGLSETTVTTKEEALDG
jgi:cytochrome d ubiquinol oxidase subunit II